MRLITLYPHGRMNQCLERWLPIEQGESGKRLTRYHLAIVPQLAYLAHRTNQRIFQHLTVEKINSMISSPGDLVGKRVCSVANTTSSTALTKLGVEFSGMPFAEDCFPGLKKGRFDAIVNDAPVLQYWVAHDGAGIGELAGPVFKEEDLVELVVLWVVLEHFLVVDSEEAWAVSALA